MVLREFILVQGESDKLIDDSGRRNWKAGPNFIAWLAFWFDLAYIVVLRDRISNNDTGFDFHLGNAFWLMLYTVVRMASF